MSNYPKTIIKDGGCEIPHDISDKSPVCVFTFAKGKTHKIYWNVGKKEALRRFESFQDEYGEHVPEASLWTGYLKEELLIDNTAMEEIQALNKILMSELINKDSQ